MIHCRSSFSMKKIFCFKTEFIQMINEKKKVLKFHQYSSYVVEVLVPLCVLTNDGDQW